MGKGSAGDANRFFRDSRYGVRGHRHRDLLFPGRTHFFCPHCSKFSPTLRLEQFSNSIHSYSWALFRRLGVFLEERGISLDVQARLLAKAAAIFQAAERTFDRREEVSGVCLEEMIEKAGRHFAFSFLRTFLVEEHLLSIISQDEKI